jgi:small GTP-binding protein
MSAKAFKIVLLGDAAVGKTSLIRRYVQDKFSQKHHGTIGAACQLHNISVGGIDYEFEIWDTAGQELYASLIPSYTRNADGACFVFDITCERSFKSFQSWFNIATSSGTAVQLIAFGNKTDLEEERVVQVQQAQGIFNDNAVEFIEGSAKTGCNVAVLFERLAEKVVETAQDRPVTIAPNLVHNDQRQCC